MTFLLTSYKKFLLANFKANKVAENLMFLSKQKIIQSQKSKFFHENSLQLYGLLLIEW